MSQRRACGDRQVWISVPHHQMISIDVGVGVEAHFLTREEMEFMNLEFTIGLLSIYEPGLYVASGFGSTLAGETHKSWLAVEEILSSEVNKSEMLNNKLESRGNKLQGVGSQ